MNSKLTFYVLVADLEKLRDQHEQLQINLQKAGHIYPGLARDSRFQQITEQVATIQAGYDPIIADYRQKNLEAEKAETYNREMDERNRIATENREKPWLPLYDGE